LLAEVLDSCSLTYIMVKYSAGSVQQTLRRITGVVASQQVEEGGVEPKYYTRVQVQHRDYLERFDDDAFITMTRYIFGLLVTRMVEVTNTNIDQVQEQPAFVFVPRYNPDKIMESFDQEFFEDKVLPEAAKHERLAGFIDRYNRAKAICVDWVERTASMVDAIHAFFYELRKTPISLGFIVDETSSVPAEQALRNMMDIETVRLRSETDVLLPAFKAVHPDGVVLESKGNFYFVVKKTDPFKAIGSRSYYPDISNVPIARLTKAKVVPPVVPTGVKGTIENLAEDDLAYIRQQVRSLLTKPEQRMNADEKLFREHGGFPGFTDINSDYHLSSNALTGFGKILGEGVLETCLMRLADHIRNKTGRPLRECYYFAAGRVCRMNSNKKLLLEDDNVVLRDK